MEIQDKWGKFAATGRVADYLEYRLGMEEQTAQVQNRTGDKTEGRYGSGNDRSDGNGADRLTG